MDEIVYFGPEDVQKYIGKEWTKLVKSIEKVFGSYSSGNVSQPVRSAVHVNKQNGVLFAMPAYDAKENVMSAKVVSLFPKNKEMHLSTIHATILYYDACNGKLKAILDGDLITKMRTAAASVVATKYLAEKTEVLCVLGSGAQARSHIMAFTFFYTFKKISIWNINKEGAQKLAADMRDLNLDCAVCDTVESAVKDADIIITATLAEKPVLRKEWVKQGVHINAVGAPVPEAQELDEKLMLSSIVYVDSKEGALAESGDIIQSKAPIYAEIGEVVLGLKEAYPTKTTIFKSLGMGAEDTAAAVIVYENYLLSKQGEDTDVGMS